MNRPLIRLGSKGPSVRELKVLLNHALKPSPELSPGNDNFGPNTLKAVNLFQRAAHLKVDGLVGDDTWTALLGRATSAVKHVAHRASLGLSSGNQSHQTRKAVSFTHGVKNPIQRDPNPTELSLLQAHQKKARQYMEKAQRLLHNMKSQPSSFANFHRSFMEPTYGSLITASSGKPIQLAPADLQRAKRAEDNFTTMLSTLSKGGIVFKVFESKPTSNDGKDVYAYTGFDNNGQGAYIAFSKQFHIDSVESIQIDTFIHELAHFVLHAGHAYEGGSWDTAMKGADRYARYAVDVWA